MEVVPDSETLRFGLGAVKKSSGAVRHFPFGGGTDSVLIESKPSGRRGPIEWSFETSETPRFFLKWSLVI